MTTAWAYVRVSGDEQADRGLPVAGQREAIERYAQAHGYTVDRFFIDEARSGATDRREQFQLLMHLAHRAPPPCQVILLWSWSRFARDQTDAHYWKASLRRQGVQIVDISGEAPSATGFEYVFEALIHWKDEQKLAEISLQARRGQQTLARLGYIPSGCRPPTGYRVELAPVEINGRSRQARRWVPDPATWPLVERAWAMRLQGLGYKTIWRELGLYKSPSHYEHMFANRAYCGEVRFGETIIPVQPMVTPEQWERVNANRAHRRSGAYARRQTSPYLLSGLLTCARCGAALAGQRSGVARRNDGYTRSPWPHYICTAAKRGECDLPRIAAPALDQAVLGALWDTILTEANLAQIMAQIEAQRQGELPALRAQLDQAQTQIVALQRAVDHLLDALESAPESSALTARLRQREADLAHQRAQAAQLRAQIDGPAAALPSAAALRAHLQAALHDGPPDQVHALLRQIIHHIATDRAQATLHYTPPLSDRAMFAAPLGASIIALSIPLCREDRQG